MSLGPTREDRLRAEGAAKQKVFDDMLIQAQGEYVKTLADAYTALYDIAKELYEMCDPGIMADAGSDEEGARALRKRFDEHMKKYHTEKKP